jgi:hypothetical protein
VRFPLARPSQLSPKPEQEAPTDLEGEGPLLNLADASMELDILDDGIDLEELAADLYAEGQAENANNSINDEATIEQLPGP